MSTVTSHYLLFDPQLRIIFIGQLSWLGCCSFCLGLHRLCEVWLLCRANEGGWKKHPTERSCRPRAFVEKSKNRAATKGRAWFTCDILWPVLCIKTWINTCTYIDTYISIYIKLNTSDVCALIFGVSKRATSRRVAAESISSRFLSHQTPFGRALDL